MTLAAAAVSATLLINAAALDFGSLGGSGCSLLGVCTADRPLGVTLAAAAASATLLINAAALALGSIINSALESPGIPTRVTPVGEMQATEATYSPRPRSTSLVPYQALQQAQLSPATPIPLDAQRRLCCDVRRRLDELAAAPGRRSAWIVH
jgi:hypothetical protein